VISDVAGWSCSAVEGGTTNSLPACRALPRWEWTLRAGLLFPISPQSDQEPSPLVVVQRKLLDGYGLSPLAIGRFDRAEIFATASHDGDASASQVGGLFGIGTPGHASMIMAAEREGESARHVAFMGRTDQFKVGAAC
jgi:hypothetical protein